MAKIQVGVLGATGMIGQRFIQLLEEHPMFEIAGLYASERSEGKRLEDVIKVRDHEFRSEVLEMRIEQLKVSQVPGMPCRVLRPALRYAGEFESQLAQAGTAVVQRCEPSMEEMCPCSYLSATPTTSSWRRNRPPSKMEASLSPMPTAPPPGSPFP
jgi:aspartate-semialdehyde dehydrogenase